MRKPYLIALLGASALAMAGCGDSADKAEPAANETNAAAPAEAPADAAADENAAGSEESAATEAGGQQDFTIVNNTGRVVMTLNVSPNDSNEWGPDILGTATIANGQSGQVTFPREQEQCLWDLRATFDDGQTGDWRGVNLCETTTVTLTPA